MTDTSVIYLDSTMTGHPQLSGTVGTGIDVLSGLVTGFNTKTLTSLTRTGTTATATLTGHGFNMITTGLGPVIEIAGVNEAGWNGKWRLSSVDSNTFTFTCPDTLTTPATGTITAKYAGAGWTKPYTGTNKAAFRSAVAGSAHLRIDDSATREMRPRGWYDMTDVDTGTGPFPTDAQVSGGLYLPKSSVASGAERVWILVADQALMALFIAHDFSYSAFSTLVFGRPVGFKADDAYHDLIIAANISHFSQTVEYGSDFDLINTTTQYGHYFAAGVSQSGNPVLFAKHGISPQSYMGGLNGWVHPPISDGGIRAAPIFLVESTSGQDRGILPGMFQPVTDMASAGITHGGFYTPTSGPLAGRKLLLVRIRTSSLAFVFVDLTGPWR